MKNLTLWLLALIATLGAAAYQRRTGPTYPERGQAVLGATTIAWELPRSHSTSSDAEGALAAPAGIAGEFHWRRLRSDDPWREAALARQGERLVGILPAQPPAGKLEYYLTLAEGKTAARIPAEGAGVLIRFRGDVPAGILIPHIALMFIAMWIGVRAGLGALFAAPGTRKIARWALAGMTVGGMFLGPWVQSYAFGAWWTGWPYGGDLTDNKTLIMWLAWIVAVACLGRVGTEVGGWRRSVVVVAAVVMLVVFMIPHSLRGSELDFRALDRGAQPAASVRTG